MRRSIEVQSHREGDALNAALGSPVIRTVSVITGLLLELPGEAVRGRVLALVQASLQLAGDYAEPPDNGHPVTAVTDLRLHHGDANTPGE